MLSRHVPNAATFGHAKVCFMLFRWGSKPPSNTCTWFLGPTLVQTPNGIFIGASAFAGHMNVSSSHTYAHRPRNIGDNMLCLYGTTIATAIVHSKLAMAIVIPLSQLPLVSNHRFSRARTLLYLLLSKLPNPVTTFPTFALCTS